MTKCMGLPPCAGLWPREAAYAIVVRPQEPPHAHGEGHRMPPDYPSYTMQMTPRSQELAARVVAFMDAHVYPAEAVFAREIAAAQDRWEEPPIIADLKTRA